MVWPLDQTVEVKGALLGSIVKGGGSKITPASIIIIIVLY